MIHKKRENLAMMAEKSHQKYILKKVQWLYSYNTDISEPYKTYILTAKTPSSLCQKLEIPGKNYQMTAITPLGQKNAQC